MPRRRARDRGLQQTERATLDLNVLRGQGAEDDVRELGAHLAAYLAGHLTDSLDRATTQVQAACVLSI